MTSNLKVLAVSLFLSTGVFTLEANRHPMEELGVKLFNNFKTNDFNSFFESSIFSFTETSFKAFLKDIRNKALRDNLIALHKIPFPVEATTDEAKWDEAFKHNWREQWRHLVRNGYQDIKDQAFTPIIEGAAEYNIQWTTTKLVACEVLLPVTWTNVGFQIKGDLDVENNASNARNLYLDRDCSYRFRLDNLTYAKAFMIGPHQQDSEKVYDEGILGNGAGQGDILVRFGQNVKTPDKLFYFCPDQKGAGGSIFVKDADDYDKPNQRTDLLLTFTYGEPTRFYQIMIKEVLMSEKGPLFCERPEWLGEVTRPMGILSGTGK